MSDGTQAVLMIADELEFIREQWKLGDQEMVKLLDEGMEASQDGLERLMIAIEGRSERQSLGSGVRRSRMLQSF